MEKDDPKAKPVAFGPFLLDRRIAVGGHAEVFLARPKAGSKPANVLVIKRPLPAARDAGGFETLDREAQLHQAVDHPNVVEVFGAGMVRGEPYLAMEFVDGVDLYKLMRRAEADNRSMPPGLAVYVARRVADALSAVHGATDGSGQPLDIVHRDVTPSNIYLSGSGDVKLGDFGIARRTVDAPPVSGGGLKGKFGYFSPEQIDLETPDNRSDLFSLTAVLGEMLIGDRVFPGSGQLAVLLAIRDVNIDPLRRARARLPDGLLEVCEKGLAKDPNDRFRNASELSEALAPFEVPSPDALRQMLAEWVDWSRDASRLADKIRGRVADSVARMRAVSRSSGNLAAVRPGTTTPPRRPSPVPAVDSSSGVSSQASSVPEPASAVKREDGSVIDQVPFAKLVEMIAVGDLSGGDLVSLMGAEYCEIREIDELARHLMPSTTQTTGHQFELGVPDYAAELADTPLIDVLAKMRRDRETGALFVQRREAVADRRKEIYLRAGRLLHVASTEREELLGEYLVRRGSLKRDALDQALARLRIHGGRLGDTLIAMGLVEAMDMFRAIRDQGRDRVAAACAWAGGRVSFYRGSAPGKVEFPLDLDLASPMMAGALHVSRGKPRDSLPPGAHVLATGQRWPSPADRQERGTAPNAMQMIPPLAKAGASIDEAIAKLTTPRRNARQIRDSEACAALITARALEWIELYPGQRA